MTAMEIADKAEMDVVRFNKLAFSIYHVTVTPTPRKAKS